MKLNKMPIKTSMHLLGCSKENCVGGYHCISDTFDRRSRIYKQSNKIDKKIIERCWALDNKGNK